MKDTFFENLLSYREQLVDQAFVDNLFKKINRRHQIRNLIISMCAIVGLFSLSMVNSLDWIALPAISQSLASIELPHITFSPESFSVLSVLLFIFIASWLIAAD